MKAVICDLDGTLCLIDHRRHHVLKTPKDWESFNHECEKDEPNVPVIELVRMYHQAGYAVIFALAGRINGANRQSIGYILITATAGHRF